MLNVDASWRAVSRKDYSPFAAGDHARPLRIVVDHLSAADNEALALLFSLAERPNVEIASTDPAAYRRVVIDVADKQDVRPVRLELPNAGFESGVSSAGSWSDFAKSTAGEHGLVKADVERAIILAQFCGSHDVDALVINSLALSLPMWRRHAEKGNVQGSFSAVALLGQFLRARRDFTVRVAEGTSIFLPEDQFYRGAAAAALGCYPETLKSAKEIWSQSGDPDGYSLLRGLEVRLGRALRARDYFQVRIRSHRPDDTWDEASFFFESFLLLLGGALDALARFCHVIFGVAGDRRHTSWHSKGWRQYFLEKEPSLGRLLAAEGRIAITSDLIATLRNYIHGEALSQEFHFAADRGGPFTMDCQPGVLAVGVKDGQRLRAAVSLLGAEDEWGIQARENDVVLVLPAAFIDRALRSTLSAISGLMEVISPLLESRYSSKYPVNPVHLVPGFEYADELRLLTGLKSIGM